MHPCLWLPVFVCEAGWKTDIAGRAWRIQELRKGIPLLVLSAGARDCAVNTGWPVGIQRRWLRWNYPCGSGG